MFRDRFWISRALTLPVIAAEPLWWESATLVTIMLLGHWIEMRSISEASGALKELAKLIPATARRLKDGVEVEVGVDQLERGDLILVRPGESVPADGRIRKGRSELNESMITGESQPVKKEEGDEVIAGTINGTGSLRVEVIGIGEDTKLHGIMRLVAEAQESKSRAQHLADRAEQLLTGVAIAAGLVTLVVWELTGAPIDFSITRFVTVLVIACPHALGLAVPLVVAISTTMGAQGGLLVRDRRGLEEARKLDIVIFDKTGTLTLGEFRVVDMGVAPPFLEETALSVAAAVESESEHPIARGIVTTASDRGIEVPSVDGFRAITGKGVAASVSGTEYQVGGPALLEAEGAKVPDVLLKLAERAAERGQAAIYLLRRGEAVAVFAVADVIREESREAIHALHERGVEVAMLTADIGIAIGAGTDVAVEAGHIVLVRSDPRDIPRIISLSRATYRKMVQNLWWAAGYNILAIPLAAGVLAIWGILLTPAAGAVLMSASTVIVAINAQLLKRVEI